MTTITVVIPTLNEERDLPNCLDSLAWADEVLIIDSGSTDRTVEIAKKYHAKVIKHKFTSFADQRNFADSQAGGQWILSIEADVTVPIKLAAEIKEKISLLDYSAYRIGRENYIWGTPTPYADWGPSDDNHIWLYKKGAGFWRSKVHETYHTDQPASQLSQHLIHLNYRTVYEYIEKIDTYSEYSSRDRSKTNWLTAIYDFAKRYFYKQGFRMGLKGLFLSYLQFVYYITLSIKKRTT